MLIIDKPSGMTSHDVVSRVRRICREPRVGHTGTLDPLATGVLPLAYGRATRLARFFSAADKDYDATIRFGLETDSYDVTGTVVQQSGRVPLIADVEQALATLRGRYLQMPPPYSAKKVAGVRAYALARRQQPVALTPVPVDVTRAVITSVTGDSVCVAITSSAGFYVRTLAQALGQLVGTGACLSALRRTRSGRFTLNDAVALDGDLLSTIVPMDALLPNLPAVRVTETGRRRLAHGQTLLSTHYVAHDVTHGPTYDVEMTVEPGAVEVAPADSQTDAGWTRLIDDAGTLTGLARAGSEPGTLHPSIVLI